MRGLLLNTLAGLIRGVAYTLKGVAYLVKGGTFLIKGIDGLIGKGAIFTLKVVLYLVKGGTFLVKITVGLVENVLGVIPVIPGGTFVGFVSVCYMAFMGQYILGSGVYKQFLVPIYKQILNPMYNFFNLLLLKYSGLVFPIAISCTIYFVCRNNLYELVSIPDDTFEEMLNPNLIPSESALKSLEKNPRFKSDILFIMSPEGTLILNPGSRLIIPRFHFPLTDWERDFINEFAKNRREEKAAASKNTFGLAYVFVAGVAVFIYIISK